MAIEIIDAHPGQYTGGKKYIGQGPTLPTSFASDVCGNTQVYS